ncbi:MAG: DUF3772 domain-containing protein [Paracoccaceae bacterium]
MTYGLGADASHRGGGVIRRLCAALVAVMAVVVLWVCAAAPLLAQAPQDMGQVLEEAVTGAGDTAGGSGSGSDGSGSDGSAGVAANANAAPMVPSQPVNGVASSLSSADFVKWEDVAARAQEAIGAAQASDSAMSELRSELATWRARFLTAQGGSANTIETLQAQIAALGPAPAEGETEAEELARQRVTLNARLTEVSAPVKAAEVAYSRADGLIQGIDRILRERQTGALMVLGPSPINPANWPAAAEAVISGSASLVTETRRALDNPAQRARSLSNLPRTAMFLMAALVILARGRRWVELLVLRVQAQGSAGRWLLSFLLSLGLILVPLIGLTLLIEGVQSSGLLGMRGGQILAALPQAGFAFLAAWWMGGRMFPKSDAFEPPLRLSTEQRREGRFHSGLLGFLLALDLVLRAAASTHGWSDRVQVVLAFPLLVLVALVLVRLSRLISAHVRNIAAANEGNMPYLYVIMRLVARAIVVLAVAGVALAAVGYFAAARAIVYPMVLSVGMMALLIVLQRALVEAYILFAGSRDRAGEALFPVLAGFSIVLLSLPVFALIWGARVTDLTEVWTKVAAGVSIGETRISPAVFLTFVLVFVVGYALTRLLQGTLKSTILPKTGLDAGGRNAITAGVGYVGIFIAAIVAITSAGIDLSSLAIVAGALSVGIGFGLQNIVSNFVSGIILLIERPISEGDWIEVGGQQGFVRDISVRSTRIETFDRTDLIVPNADFVSGTVTNYTRGNTVGRVIVPVGVAYGTDVRKVEKILRGIAEEQAMVLANPAPQVIFMAFGADSLDFEVRMILRDVTWKLSVLNDVNHAIYARFAEEGIEIPFAQRDVWLRNPEALRGGVSEPEKPPVSSDDSGLKVEPQLPPEQKKPDDESDET